ncbi:MAG: YceI family protein [Bacteroidota bacterium]|nr:YceI family protein [Bacteroidota bacterium]
MKYNIQINQSNITWEAHQPENNITGTVSFKQGNIKVLEGLIKEGFAQVDLTTIRITDSKLNIDQKQKLESHLKSADFFNVKEYPSAIFELTEVKTSSGFTTHVIIGNISIKGVMHKMEIPANIIFEGDKVDLKAKFSIIRTKHNVDFMIEESYGGKKILPEFDIEVHIVAMA